MTWADNHMESERFASDAEIASKRGNTEQAVLLYRQAAEAETRALTDLDVKKSRTLGITAVSATALWYKAGDYSQAERLTYQWLGTGFLPPFAVDQLQNLLQMIWSNRARERSGIKFIGHGVLVSVKGGEVIAGGAPLDLVVSRVGAVQAMFYRTAELQLNAPHRKHGPPSAQIQQMCRPWLLQAPQGSYQFVVTLQQPAQMDLFPETTVQIEEVAAKFLQIVQASVDDPDDTLPEIIPDPDYRATFLKLTRNLAPPPTGKGFTDLEIRPASIPDARPIVLHPDSRKTINQALRKHSIAPWDDAQDNEVQLRGILRALHLDNDWLEITIGDDHIRVDGAGEAVDDVIGPMVNRPVIIDALLSRGKHRFRDIQLDE